jgi:uncharacterized membrane protein
MSYVGYQELWGQATGYYTPEPGYRATAEITVCGIAWKDPSKEIEDLINNFFRNYQSYYYSLGEYGADINVEQLFSWIEKAKPYVTFNKITWGNLGYFEASYTLYEVESPYFEMLGVALLAVLVILGFIIIWVKIKDLASGLEKTNQAVFKNIETVEEVVNVLKANNMISQDQYNKLMEQINSAKQDVNASQQFVNQVNQQGLFPTQEIMNLLKIAIVAGIAIMFLGAVAKK